MCTFLGLQDYQWIAISSIATTAGVLIALFMPIINRKKEKNNLLYFQAKNLRMLLSDIKYIENQKLTNPDENQKAKIVAKQFLDIKVPSIEETKELAKYSIRLYEVFTGIIEDVQAVQSSAKHYIESDNPEYLEMDRAWLNSCIASLHLRIMHNSDYLFKQKVVGKYWTLIG